MGFVVEQEFLNPEGVELPPPPPPPPPMISPTVVMLVAEEKPPKLIPMARPDDGTKGQRILTNHFKGAVNKSYGEKELLTVAVTNHFRKNASTGRGSDHVGSEGDRTRVEKQFHSKTLKVQVNLETRIPMKAIEFLISLPISFDSSSLEAVRGLDIILRQNVAKQFFLKSKQEQYGDGEEITCSEYFAVYKNLPVCESADFPCITVAKLKKPAFFPLEDNEFDCIRNLQRDGVEPLLDASTTIIVKHGDVLDLPTASQIDWMKSWKVKIKKQADVQGHSHGQGRPMAIGGGGEGGVGAPGASFAQGEGKGQGGGRDGGGRQPDPRRRPIVRGKRRGNAIDLMREYHEAAAASLKYILTLFLQDYVSVEDMISHIRRVVDVHGNRALTVLHRITFMMRQNGQKVRWTVEQARTAVWDDFRRTVQSVEVVFRVAGAVEVNIHGHVRQLPRRKIPTLTELVNQIRLWGAVDGDQERFEVQIAGHVTYYDSDEIETYSHRVGWGRAIIALQGVRVSR